MLARHLGGGRGAGIASLGFSFLLVKARIIQSGLSPWAAEQGFDVIMYNICSVLSTQPRHSEWWINAMLASFKNERVKGAAASGREKHCDL